MAVKDRAQILFWGNKIWVQSACPEESLAHVHVVSTSGSKPTFDISRVSPLAETVTDKGPASELLKTPATFQRLVATQLWKLN